MWEMDFVTCMQVLCEVAFSVTVYKFYELDIQIPQQSPFRTIELSFTIIVVHFWLLLIFSSNRAGYYSKWHRLPVGHRPNHWPSCVYPHLHLHRWSCHHCLLEERWHNTQWWQHLLYHFWSDQRNNSHLQPHTDSDWETGGRVSVQCVQHQDTFRKH